MLGTFTDFLRGRHPYNLAIWGLNSMTHPDPNTASLSKSYCSTLLSFMLPTVRYTAVSSTNKIRIFELSPSGRSLTFIMLWSSQVKSSKLNLKSVWSVQQVDTSLTAFFTDYITCFRFCLC